MFRVEIAYLLQIVYIFDVTIDFLEIDFFSIMDILQILIHVYFV